MEKIKQSVYDIVFCDVQMPGKSTPETSCHGEFMTQYSWAEQFICMLETIRGETVEA